MGPLFYVFFGQFEVCVFAAMILFCFQYFTCNNDAVHFFFFPPPLNLNGKHYFLWFCLVYCVDINWTILNGFAGYWNWTWIAFIFQFFIYLYEGKFNCWCIFRSRRIFKWNNCVLDLRKTIVKNSRMLWIEILFWNKSEQIKRGEIGS